MVPRSVPDAPSVRLPAPVRGAILRIAALALLAGLGAAAAQETEIRPAPAPAAPAEEIAVSGRGTVHGEPDQAVVELGVEAVDAEARTVIDATSRAMTELQEALDELGVEERDVRTTTFDLYREEPRDRDGEPLPARYRLVHQVEVVVRDIDAVGDVLADAVEAGADRIGGVRFGIADPTELQARARRAAVEDARRKAEELADAAGRTVGRAVRISESSAEPVPQRVGFESRAMMLDAAAPPVASGQLAVTVDVFVVYALE